MKAKIKFKDNCGPWNTPTNIDNRVRDGVVALSIANPLSPPTTYRPKV
jgi:hypothetical protein